MSWKNIARYKFTRLVALVDTEITFHSEQRKKSLSFFMEEIKSASNKFLGKSGVKAMPKE